MSSRKTSSDVTFFHPFVVPGCSDELPEGDYEVLALNEVMLSYSIAAYRQTASFY